MTDWSSVPSFNDWIATCDLMDCAQEWQDIADDPRFPTAMRHEAQDYSNAIWQEIGFSTRVKP